MHALFGSTPHNELRSIGKGYTLFYSLENLPFPDPIDSLCERVSGLLRKTPVLRWKLIEGQHEDLISVERVFGYRVFVWLMNWSENSVSMKLDAMEAKYRIEEWGLKAEKYAG